jgi:hypothetical protein
LTGLSMTKGATTPLLRMPAISVVVFQWPCGTANRFDADGGGEFAFGAVQGEIDGLPRSESIHFTREGSDEMDHASGDGDAQLEADGTLTGEVRFHRGDEAAFTALRW